MEQMTRWINKTNSTVDPNLIKSIAEEFNITETFATILYNKNLESNKDFIMPTSELLNDPFLFEDMETAVKRILLAISNNEKIIIYGDYDVDGVSATALLLLFFNKIGYKNIDFYIPNRESGYGVNKDAITTIANNGANLIITVDCGITSVEEVELAKSLGVDVVVTDHHEQAEILPNAIAVINPKKNGTTYPFKGLCGTGVAYKLALAISTYYKDIEFSNNLSEFYDIVAFATIADLVPLLEENRYIVSEGVKIFNSENLRPAYRSLCENISTLSPRITSETIAFYLAPAINALGRLETVHDAVRMFLPEYSDRMEDIVKHCHACNQARKDVENAMTNSIFEKLPDPMEYDRYTILDYDSSYHTGVKGIVASKVQHKYARPTIIFNENEDNLEGSCRSIVGLNMKEALDYCSDLLLKYGGHEMAAGLTLKKDKFPEFREKFEEYARTVLTPELLKNAIYYDLPVKVNDLTFALVDDFNLFEPYGQENESPNLLIENAVVQNFSRVGKDSNTLRLKIQQNGFSVMGIGFKMGERAEELSEGCSVDIIFKPEINNYNGKKTIQMKIADFRVNDISDKENPNEVIYDRACCSDHNVKIGDKLKMFIAKNNVGEQQVLLKDKTGKRICLLSVATSELLLKRLENGIFYNFEVNTITKINGSYEISIKISPLHY